MSKSTKSAIADNVIITLPVKTEKAGSRGDKRFNRVNKRGLDCIGTLLVPMNGETIEVPVNLKVLGHQDGKTPLGFVSTSPVPSQFFIGNPSESDLEVWFDLTTVNESDGVDKRHERIITNVELAELVAMAKADGGERDVTQPKKIRYTYPKDSAGYKAGKSGFTACTLYDDDGIPNGTYAVTNARQKKG